MSAVSPSTVPATSSADRRARHALWAALVLILFWGANFSVQKAVFTALSPGGFLFVRYLMMPVAAALLLVWRFGLAWPRLARADARALLELGLAGHLLHIGFATYGIYWSTAFSSSVILACGPIFTLLILRWKGVEHLKPGQVAGVGVACLGVLVFLSDKLLGGHWRASGGDLVLLIAAFFFSYYTVTAKPLIERLGGVTVMTYGVLFGSLPVVLLGLPAGLQVTWSEVSPVVWLGTIYAVLISAFLGWLVWGWINGILGVARSAPLMYLMPPVAGAVAWLVTGERFTTIKVLGAGITLGGVALAQFLSPPRDPVREAPAPVD